MQTLTVLVIGSGAWGTTLHHLLTQQGHQVRVWSRRSPTPIATVLDQVDLLVSAVSMSGVRSTIAQLQTATLPSNVLIVSATKGLDSQAGLDKTFPLLPSQLWQAAFPANPVVVLSGPNLAKEIAQGLPAASVVASQDSAAAIAVQQAFSSSRFRVYTNPDTLGVELGGTLKNVMAIALGACDGLHLGNNAKAALITRGLAEIIRIGLYWGAKPETLTGLSGLGDLLATCAGSLSRNYQVGYGLAQGQALTDILANLEGTAEGINTSQVIAQLANQHAIEAPICELVYQLLQGEITPAEAVSALMTRDYKPETL